MMLFTEQGEKVKGHDVNCLTAVIAGSFSFHGSNFCRHNIYIIMIDSNVNCKHSNQMQTFKFRFGVHVIKAQ